MVGHTLRLFPGRYGICRVDPNAAPPPWAKGPGLVSITRTPEELSILCPEDRIPERERCERGWRCLQVAGPLSFEAIGVLASLVGPLEGAGTSVLSVSTYDTDYVFVREPDLPRATLALTRAGHTVIQASA